MRILRGSRIFKRWETRVSINYGVLAMVRAILMLLFCAHWAGCIWGLQATMGDDITQTWIGGMYSCDPPEPSSGAAAARTLEMADCVHWGTAYTASFYFAVMTITSIGYGDVHAHSRNPGEMWVATVIMIVGSCVFGAVLAGDLPLPTVTYRHLPSHRHLTVT